MQQCIEGWRFWLHTVRAVWQIHDCDVYMINIVSPGDDIVHTREVMFSPASLAKLRFSDVPCQHKESEATSGNGGGW